LPSSLAMIVMYVVYARCRPERLFSASITDRTVSSPEAQSCSMTSDSSSCNGGGAAARERFRGRFAIYDRA